MLAEQVLSRAAGAPLVDGNRVRLLCDARENYPAWLDAIANARRVVLFENYIIQNDSAGQRFAEALIERARAGVRVCVIYDWFGGLGLGSRRLLKPLRDAGGEVRVFNPLSIASPLGWMQRDHRPQRGEAPTKPGGRAARAARGGTAAGGRGGGRGGADVRVRRVGRRGAEGARRGGVGRSGRRLAGQGRGTTYR